MTDTTTPDSETEPMLAVYRHDVHKLQLRSHMAAHDTLAGVPVNEQVPQGADADAARLSRPEGEPEQTVTNHTLPYRLSLLTGRVVAEDDRTSGDVDRAVRQLVRIDEPAAMHAAWLSSSIAAWFPESVYYPYTSVKYHTLLAAALLSNYRAGHTFEDLCLVVDDPTANPVPHRTIIQTDHVHLRLTATPGDQPAAPLGPAPVRSWADVWSRLPAQSLPVDTSRRARILDAQLRRIRAWSTALQFIEEYEAMAQRLGGGL